MQKISLSNGKSKESTLLLIPVVKCCNTADNPRKQWTGRVKVMVGREKEVEKERNGWEPYSPTSAEVGVGEKKDKENAWKPCKIRHGISAGVEK